MWYVQAFLPPLAANEDHLGYAQFVDMHDNPAGAIDWLIPLAMRKGEEEGKLFQRLGHTLFNNLCQISGINPDRDNPAEVLNPQENRKIPAADSTPDKGRRK